MNSNPTENFFQNMGKNSKSPFNRSNGHGGNGSGRNGGMVGTNEGNKQLMKFVLWILAGLLGIILIVLVIFGVKYYLSDCKNKKDFTDYLFSLDLENPCDGGSQAQADVGLGQGSGEGAFVEREIKNEDEVYLIGDQVYNYDEARCKCNNYGAKLATREQVIDSYNKGSDNCLYGWAEGRNAFYTTQKCTWDKIQRGPVEERAKCGMPGVNGGYFANPGIKFGALCYGVRPEGEVAVEKKPYCKKQPYCSQVNDLVKKSSGDKIVPFSSSKWSQWK